MQTGEQYLLARGHDAASSKHNGFTQRGKIWTATNVGPASDSIEIPNYHPLTGEVRSRVWRILDVSKTRDGETRFLGKKDAPQLLSFPKPIGWKWKTVLADPGTSLDFVEGPIKAATCVLFGLRAIAIAGKDNWRRKGTLELLEDFDLIEIEGRVGNFTPDYDFTYKPAVRKSWFEFADAWERRGGKALFRLLPHVNDGVNTGPDDYLVYEEAR